MSINRASQAFSSLFRDLITKQNQLLINPIVESYRPLPTLNERRTHKFTHDLKRMYKRFLAYGGCGL